MTPDETPRPDPAAPATATPAPGAGPGERPVAGAWVEGTPRWTRVPGGPLAVADLPGDARTTWAVVREVDAVADLLRALDPDDPMAELVERHVAHAGRGSHRHARFDRGPDGRLVLTLPTVSFLSRTRDVHTGWVTCVLRPGLVVVAEDGDAGVVAAVAAKLEDDLPEPDEGPHAVLAAVLLVLLQAAGDVEAEVGDAVARIERTVFSARASSDVLAQVYALKREIAEARRAVGPVGATLPDVADAWAQRTHGHRTPAWLRRVESGADRVDRHLDAHDRLLGDMVSVHLAQVSVRQNEDMRRISAWAAVIAVPTLVAGVYGMNFRHMPELDWTFGYPLALALMGGACLALWRSFRRSGWL